MADVPDLAAVKEYLGGESDHSWEDEEIQAALTAQVGDQAARLKATAVATYPDPLPLALCRRVHVALALKALPLGVQVTVSETNAATTRVGSPGRDPLVRELEAPYRRRVVG